MTHYLDDSRFLASSNFTYVNTGAISCRMCLYWRSRNTDGRRVVLCARARHFTISDPPWFFPTFVFAPYNMQPWFVEANTSPERCTYALRVQPY